MQTMSSPQATGFRSLAELTKNFQEKQRACPVLKELSTHVESLPLEFTEPDEVLAISQTTGSTQVTGTLRKVFPNKGFAFIAPSDGSRDVFLHFRDLVNGGSRDLVVGAELYFELFIDEHRNRKARNASMSKVCEAETSIALQSSADPATQVYNRQFLVSTLGCLRRSVGFLNDNPGVPTTRYMPRNNGKSLYEENPELNDEDCVIRLEARLSYESGADKNNADTFGDAVKGGWSFEEALEANNKFARCRFGSGDSTPTQVGDSSSECECAGQDLSPISRLPAERQFFTI
jgi:CspA family cold shock protein